MTFSKTNLQTVGRQSTISEEEMIELRGEFFGLGGQNGQYEVSTKDVRSLLVSMRIKLRLMDSDIDLAIQQFDKDGDGRICINELNEIFEKYNTQGVIYKALSQRSQIRKEFERFDTDNNGFIGLDELVGIVNERTGLSITEKHIEPMLNEVDKNNDGLLDYEEFCTLMTRTFMQKRVMARSPKSIDMANNEQKFTFE